MKLNSSWSSYCCPSTVLPMNHASKPQQCLLCQSCQESGPSSVPTATWRGGITLSSERDDFLMLGWFWQTPSVQGELLPEGEGSWNPPAALGAVIGIVIFSTVTLHLLPASQLWVTGDRQSKGILRHPVPCCWGMIPWEGPRAVPSPSQPCAQPRVTAQPSSARTIARELSKPEKKLIKKGRTSENILSL